MSKKKTLTCEADFTPSDKCCIVTHFLVSFWGGDPYPICGGHLIVELKQHRTGFDQPQPVTITFAD